MCYGARSGISHSLGVGGLSRKKKIHVKGIKIVCNVLPACERMPCNGQPKSSDVVQNSQSSLRAVARHDNDLDERPLPSLLVLVKS